MWKNPTPTTEALKRRSANYQIPIPLLPPEAPRQKLPFNSHEIAAKHSSYLHSPVVGVQKNLSQCYDLRSPVPAVGAVNQHGPPFSVHRAGDQHSCLQHDGKVLQPLGALQG